MRGESDAFLRKNLFQEKVKKVKGKGGNYGVLDDFLLLIRSHKMLAQGRQWSLIIIFSKRCSVISAHSRKHTQQHSAFSTVDLSRSSKIPGSWTALLYDNQWEGVPAFFSPFTGSQALPVELNRFGDNPKFMWQTPTTMCDSTALRRV